MTKLYLIRHAEAEGNLYRIAQGQCNSLITDLGLRQIEALRRRFEPIAVDAVYASDLYRTCKTAQAVCAPKGLPLHPDQRLREICVGAWEQRTWGDIARTDAAQMENFSKHLDAWHVPGAETPEQVRDRMVQAVGDIAAENPGKTVAVFSHGCAIRILMGTLQGIPIARIGETPLGGNTAVSLLEAEGETLQVVFRDDLTHLEQENLCRKKRGSPLTAGLWFAEQQEDELPEDVRALCAGAPQKTLLAGFQGETAVGALELLPQRDAENHRGWIAGGGVLPALRSRGYGVQLLGQAVQFYRPLGRETLCVSLAAGHPAEGFFRAGGFSPVSHHGAEVRWEKEIAFRPLETLH